MSDDLDTKDVNGNDHVSTDIDSDNVQEIPQEMAHLDVTDRGAMRCPETGKFLPGWKGGGRPKGAKDKLNMQVIGTLEKLWSQRGEEIMEHLAAEKPEVLAGLVAKLIPQSLAAEAIEGEASKHQGNQEVTVRVVTQQHQDVLPPREVEGELIDENDSQHLTH